MYTLKRLLVATDCSRLGNDAVHRAVLLAARENAELLIVHAFPRRSTLNGVFCGDADLPVRLHAYQAPFEAKRRCKGFPEEDFLRYAEMAP